MDRQNIFNQDVYPTPSEVLDKLELDVNNRVVLEPHAGTGNIIRYVQEYGASKVYYSEINKNLASLHIGYAEQVGTDFLEVESESISDVDIIVMNPPFSNWVKHIEHAWEIAPEGCEIVSLCNADTLSRLWRTPLNSLIDNYGFDEYLGTVFSDAERKTDVKVSYIKLFKPISTDSMDFDDYFDEVDDSFDISSSEGIVRYSEIDALVNGYKAVVKQSEVMFAEIDKMKDLGKILDLEISAEAGVRFSEKAVSVPFFLKQTQIKLWYKVFDMFNLDKYVTKGVRENLSSFIKSKSNLPFTKRNIFKMVEMIFSASSNILNDALIEAVDNFTMYTKENRYNVEGWATNKGHLLHKKIIIPYMVDPRGENVYITSRSYRDKMEDLIRVLCNLTGSNYDNEFGFRYGYEFPRGEWVEDESTFFRFKGFKKGTVHLEFKDKDVWARVNRAYAQAKGSVLPEKI